PCSLTTVGTSVLGLVRPRPEPNYSDTDPEVGSVPAKLPRPHDRVDARPADGSASLHCAGGACRHAARRIAGVRRPPEIGHRWDFNVWVWLVSSAFLIFLNLSRRLGHCRVRRALLSRNDRDEGLGGRRQPAAWVGGTPAQLGLDSGISSQPT